MSIENEIGEEANLLITYPMAFLVHINSNVFASDPLFKILVS